MFHFNMMSFIIYMNNAVRNFRYILLRTYVLSDKLWTSFRRFEFMFSRKTKKRQPNPLISRSSSCIDDVLSLNNSRFGDFVARIYPIELEIKDTTDGSSSYLNLHLENDSEWRLRTKLDVKRDDFNFPIVKFTLICSNIPAAPAYGVYTCQLIRYSRACRSYQDFLDRGYLITRKLLHQWFYGCHLDLITRYGISVSKMTTDMFHLS